MGIIISKTLFSQTFTLLVVAYMSYNFPSKDTCKYEYVNLFLTLRSLRTNYFYRYFSSSYFFSVRRMRYYYITDIIMSITGGNTNKEDNTFFHSSLIVCILHVLIDRKKKSCTSKRWKPSCNQESSWNIQGGNIWNIRTTFCSKQNEKKRKKDDNKIPFMQSLSQFIK